MRSIILLLCLVSLGACAFVDNSHPRNAMPLEAGEYRTIYGLASSNNIYHMGRYEPDSLNAELQNRPIVEYATQTPIIQDLGLGNGFAIGFQGGAFFGPGFKGRGYEQLYSDMTMNFYAKVNLQKSIELGSDTYIAVFPAVGIGRGIEALAQSHRIRYKRISVELPVTISKFVPLSTKTDLIFSLSARSARDWLMSDINGPGPGAWSYTAYLDQPQNEFKRHAAMAHIDFFFSKRWNIAVQAGAEYSTGDSGTKWSPIFYLGLGPKTIRKF
ncbi:MAG: hypothetical protein RBR69_07495 [Candidatus Cloacimonadaceae bacterium]|nr:hypothetical protein [Candidatus Cloacimonadota bacterium]MDY0127958.1 hypothetical protein [Candidatus Cloacimonadaceae bacterium]MCB5254122.1 hypothetical protein [Candidatus Cloacimonadota bacterium]MCK9178576.1 hypothetical protein [Candidatus Cloacimonadota bacterium]MCK9242401.1 hypothetical protein [Candidatus Cloacimonadota bacterium]